MLPVPIEQVVDPSAVDRLALLDQLNLVVRTLEQRYGIIRAQALPPRASLEFIEKLRGET